MSGMRALTITAALATIVAIPFLLSKRRTKVPEDKPESGVQPYDDPRRYDVFDFIG